MKYKLNGKSVMLFSFFLFFSILKAQNVEKFDINDPRNPQCPCHKYQKLADDEFKRLLRAGNKTQGEFVGIASSEGKTSSVSGNNSDKIYKTSDEKYRKQKRRIKDKMHRQPRWLYEFKNWDIWKRPNRPIKCPIWNK